MADGTIIMPHGRTPTVLVVDDNENNVIMLDYIINSNGYNVIQTFGGEEALRVIQEKRADIDLIISDIMMPGVDGLALTNVVKSDDKTRHIPIILLTAKQREHGDVARGLDIGAEDYLIKPVDSLELMARVRSLLRSKKLQDELTELKNSLEQQVEERSIEILITRDAAMFGFAKLAEYRDPETGKHLERIRDYTRVLAEELRRLEKYKHVIDDEFISMIFQSSPLHDIGKVGVPDAILLKPGKLTAEEFEIMKTHATIGGDSLAATERRCIGGATFLKMGKEIAYYHHEKWNGMGYPKGLKGEEIPLAARIMALADVYDALVSVRVYKPAMPHEKARRIIVEDSGKHFDPELVDAFISIENTFLEIRGKYMEEEESASVAFMAP